MGVYFTHKGNFNKVEKYFNKLLNRDYLNVIDQYAQQGLAALRSATPKDSGRTADCWSYEIRSEIGATSLVFTNSNVNKGVNIAVILQYGHGTRNGGYVQGIDYINPALEPVFQQIADACFKEVTS